MPLLSLGGKILLGLFGGLIIIFSALNSSSTPQSTPLPNQEFQNKVVVATTTPIVEQKKATTTVKMAVKVLPPKPKPIVPPPTTVVVQQIEIPSPLPPTTLGTTTSINDLNDRTRNSIVNILCTTKTGGAFQPISGSGVIIDKRGVILTNSHVAEYFLLKDYIVKDFIQCVVRTGSPATPKYNAELLYISPAWINDNRTNITSEDPLGTGEHDFALLRITGPVGPSIVMPSEFPAIDPAVTDDEIADDSSGTYITAGYPAGFLGGIAIQRDLYIASTVSSIQQKYTFKDGNLDVIALGGSVLAQKGASGGGVVNQKNGKLVGIIVTTTNAAETGDRNLRAVTLSYINRDLNNSLGVTLAEYLFGDIAGKAAKFNQEIAPTLTDVLLMQLNKHN